MQNLPYSALLANAQTLIANGQLTAAIAFLKNAITKQPDFYDGWLLFSKCLFDAGYFKEAIEVAQGAERFDPLVREFQAIQGQIQKNAIDQAQITAEQMLIKHPGHPRAIFTLAHIASSRNQLDSSVDILKNGLFYSPANLMLRQMLVTNQESAGDYQGAIDSAQTLAQTADSFDTLWILITLLLKLGQHHEILDLCERAVKKCAGDLTKLSQINWLRGQTLKLTGKRKEAISALRASLVDNPKNADAWWALADMKNFTFLSNDTTAIQALINTPGVSQSAKCIATFALAKASESEANWESTMFLYNAANRLRDNHPFNPMQVKKEFFERRQAYTKKVLGIRAKSEIDELTPIFIVGLPRSGSTLVEQILASHSSIEGTIEQPTLPSIEKKAQALCVSKFNSNLFSSLASLSPQDLHQLGRAYIKNGTLFRHTDRPFFTDKQPFNFRHIGFIHKILPKAIIIDVRRNPLDCGFSLFKQYFPAGVDFSYKLSHIGEFYNEYVKLMDYWESVLPGKVLRVQYEALIQRPEQEIRELLDHVGVKFESECLHFHKSKRIVHTASSEQVRQPINTNGIGSWRKAKKALSELESTLDADILDANRRYIQMS